MSVKTDLQALLVTLSSAETANDTAVLRASFQYTSGEQEPQAVRRESARVEAQTKKMTKDSALAAVIAYVEALP